MFLVKLILNKELFVLLIEENAVEANNEITKVNVNFNIMNILYLKK